MTKYKGRTRSAFNLVLRELGIFFKGASLNIFSQEFLAILIPILTLWEILPLQS